MRFFFFVLLSFSFSIIPFLNRSFAQEEQNIEAQETVPGKSNPYALASDPQIKEAQAFYTRCKDNKTLSEQKDCKCAAAAYLETRLRLGDSASVDDIMKENVNSCLLDEAKGHINNAEELDLDAVTEQQKAEAQLVYETCVNDRKMARNLDCECLAAKFLDRRLKDGPLEDKDTIVLELAQSTCRNVVETTGAEYEKCMLGDSFDYQGIRPKDYCECYARMWGKLFEAYNGRIDANRKASIRLKARTTCRNPAAYADQKQK